MMVENVRFMDGSPVCNLSEVLVSFRSMFWCLLLKNSTIRCTELLM